MIKEWFVSFIRSYSIADLQYYSMVSNIDNLIFFQDQWLNKSSSVHWSFYTIEFVTTFKKAKLSMPIIIFMCFLREILKKSEKNNFEVNVGTRRLVFKQRQTDITLETCRTYQLWWRYLYHIHWPSPLSKDLS